MSVFNSQYFDRRYLGPVQFTVFVCRNRVMVRGKNQTIGMVEINRQLTRSFSLRELMTTLRRAFGWPEVFKCRSSTSAFIRARIFFARNLPWIFTSCWPSLKDFASFLFLNDMSIDSNGWSDRAYPKGLAHSRNGCGQIGNTHPGPCPWAVFSC